MARSHKTPQLMRLLTGSPDIVNPFLDEEFKEEVMRAEKNPEPVKPVSDPEGKTVINVTTELVSQWVPKVMQRFNVCACQRCVAEVMIDCYEAIPPVVVNINSDSDVKKAEELKSKNQQKVIMQVINMTVKRKSLPRH